MITRLEYSADRAYHGQKRTPMSPSSLLSRVLGIVDAFLRGQSRTNEHGSIRMIAHTATTLSTVNLSENGDLY